jgi:hypothetical protein
MNNQASYLVLALAMIFMVTNVLGAAFALSRKSARQNIASRGESIRAKWDVALARPILAVVEVAGVLVIVTGFALGLVQAEFRRPRNFLKSKRAVRPAFFRHVERNKAVGVTVIFLRPGETVKAFQPRRVIRVRLAFR